MFIGFNYQFFDPQGFVIGFFAFFLALVYALYLVSRFNLKHVVIFKLLILCAIGHFIGAILYYWFSITAGSDSVIYFKHEFRNDGSYFGYSFAMTLLDFLKKYLLGESLSGAFFLFAACGFIGSVHYLLTFKTLLDRASVTPPSYLIDNKQLFYPALLLLCWPSYFFWPVGLVKDSFSFTGASMFLFAIAQKKQSVFSLITFSIGILISLLVRPYLFVIGLAATLSYLLLGSKAKLHTKIILLVIIGIFTVNFIPFIQNYGFISNSVDTIGHYIITQQKNMNLGSSIPMPTQNPKLVFFFLPYLIMANLFLPLIYGAKNLIGIIGSIENAYFVSWVWFFIKNRSIWRELKKKLPILIFFMLYFLFGISCLSMMSTNIGLAMREKILYVPALLMCIFLVYAYRRILIIELITTRETDSEINTNAA